MFALLLPIGLAALAALLLPALIHLARRSEEQRTDFAALRWLSEKPKPRQRLRFDEWPLLLLRLLLLALVALWLARPILNDADDTARWVVAVPGIDAAAARAAAAKGDELRWLAPGFPAIDDRPAPPAAPVASLLRQLDAELPAKTALTLLVPERLTGLDGERPRLSRTIDWQIRPGAMTVPAPTMVAAPALAVRYAPADAGGVRYLRAAAVAWQPAGKSPAFAAAPLAEPLPDGRQLLVWLAAGPLPENVTQWIARGGTALVAAGAEVDMRGAVGGPLADERTLGRGRLLQLRQPLTPTALPQLLEPDFPRLLRDQLAPPVVPPASAHAADVAPLTGGRAYPQAARELQPGLALLIAVLLLIERIAATRRARRPAP